MRILLVILTLSVSTQAALAAGKRNRVPDLSQRFDGPPLSDKSELQARCRSVAREADAIVKDKGRCHLLDDLILSVESFKGHSGYSIKGNCGEATFEKVQAAQAACE